MLVNDGSVISQHHASEAAVPPISPQYTSQNYLTQEPIPAQRRLQVKTLSSRLSVHQDYPRSLQTNSTEARAQYARQRQLQMKSVVLNPSD